MQEPDDRANRIMDVVGRLILGGGLELLFLFVGILGLIAAAALRP